MSRGLSRQQLQILGLATAVSRLRYGNPRAHTPQTARGWRVPIVDGAPFDVRPALAAHVLGGVKWVPNTTMGTTHSTIRFEATPVAKSVRSSMSRAVELLRRRGFLAYGFADRRGYHHDYGYVLTTPGLAIGLLHELRIPDLERRLWLLRVPAAKQMREEWNVYEPLGSPEISLRADKLGEPDVEYSGWLTPWTWGEREPFEWGEWRTLNSGQSSA